MRDPGLKLREPVGGLCERVCFFLPPKVQGDKYGKRQPVRTRYAWLSDLLKLPFFQAAEKKLIPELRGVQLIDIAVD